MRNTIGGNNTFLPDLNASYTGGKPNQSAVGGFTSNIRKDPPVRGVGVPATKPETNVGNIYRKVSTADANTAGRKNYNSRRDNRCRKEIIIKIKA